MFRAKHMPFTLATDSHGVADRRVPGFSRLLELAAHVRLACLCSVAQLRDIGPFCLGEISYFDSNSRILQLVPAYNLQDGAQEKQSTQRHLITSLSQWPPPVFVARSAAPPGVSLASRARASDRRPRPPRCARCWMPAPAWTARRVMRSPAEV